MVKKKISIIVFTTLVSVIALVSYNHLVKAEGAVNVEMFDSCKNVTFRVTNNRNVAIEVKQIKYYNASKGKWKTEDIGGSNARCERGASCTIGGSSFNYNGEDLADAEGDRLTKIVFIFEDVNSNTRYQSQEFLPTDPVCRVDKEYGHGQGWTLNGTSDANSQNSSNGLGDECKNVSFLVKNNTNQYAIYITKVKYFNRNSGNWKTENVSEVRCDQGVTCTVGGQDDLADAKDDDITKISFIYNYYLPNTVAKKSENKESKVFNPSSPKCTEGKIYGTGQGWTIGNAGTSTPSVSSGTATSNSNSSASTSTNSNSSNTPSVNANSGTMTNNSINQTPKVKTGTMTTTTIQTTNRQTNKTKRKNKKP